MMLTPSYMIHYKGHKIIYEYLMYHLSSYPTKKYISVKDVTSEIDKIENDFKSVLGKINNEPDESTDS